jgi:hypothetical protein
MAVDDILTNTINFLQVYNRAVTGVRLSPPLASYLTVLDSANCPYAMSWPVQSTWHHKGQGGAPKRIDQAMQIIVFVEPLGANDIPSRAAEAVLLLQRFRNKYLDPASVPVFDPTGSEPYQITIEEGEGNPHSDTGLVSNLIFGGKAFHGFQMTVHTRILIMS